MHRRAGACTSCRSATIATILALTSFNFRRPILFKAIVSRIVLLEKIHASAVAHLTTQGFSNIVEVPKALAGAELLMALAQADAIGIRSNTHLTAEVLTALPQLRAIGCFCIGTNQVDLGAATNLGIPVFNAPFSNTRSVAELVIAQAILLLRRIPEKNARTHRGIWDKTAQGAFEVRNKVLGIIGYGNIGTQVGILAESVGMRVCYYDTESKLPLGNAQPLPTLEALLAQADVVTLHVPGGAGTDRLISNAQLARFKQGAVLINASRGRVVEIDALDHALRSGGLDNVILTPHIGGSTEEAQDNIGREVADKLARYLKAGTTRSAVNFPDIAHQEKQAQSRILHVHHNEPGVIARMNASFAAAGLNIVAQQLQTRGAIGYAITDVDAPIAAGLMQALCQDPATIRCSLV